MVLAVTGNLKKQTQSRTSSFALRVQGTQVMVAVDNRPLLEIVTPVIADAMAEGRFEAWNLFRTIDPNEGYVPKPNDVITIEISSRNPYKGADRPQVVNRAGERLTASQLARFRRATSLSGRSLWDNRVFDLMREDDRLQLN